MHDEQVPFVPEAGNSHEEQVCFAPQGGNPAEGFGKLNPGFVQSLHDPTPPGLEG